MEVASGDKSEKAEGETVKAVASLPACVTVTVRVTLPSSEVNVKVASRKIVPSLAATLKVKEAASVRPLTGLTNQPALLDTLYCVLPSIETVMEVASGDKSEKAEGETVKAVASLPACVTVMIRIMLPSSEVNVKVASREAVPSLAATSKVKEVFSVRPLTGLTNQSALLDTLYFTFASISTSIEAASEIKVNVAGETFNLGISLPACVTVTVRTMLPSSEVNVTMPSRAVTSSFASTLKTTEEALIAPLTVAVIQSTLLVT